MVDSDFGALQGSELPGEVAWTNDLNAAACRVTLSAGIDKIRLVVPRRAVSYGEERLRSDNAHRDPAKCPPPDRLEFAPSGGTTVDVQGTD